MVRKRRLAPIRTVSLKKRTWDGFCVWDAAEQHRGTQESRTIVRGAVREGVGTPESGHGWCDEDEDAAPDAEEEDAPVGTRRVSKDA